MPSGFKRVIPNLRDVFGGLRDTSGGHRISRVVEGAFQEAPWASSGFQVVRGVPWGLNGF